MAKLTVLTQRKCNKYKISIKEYVEKTNAIGIQAKAGRYMSILEDINNKKLLK